MKGKNYINLLRACNLVGIKRWETVKRHKKYEVRREYNPLTKEEYGGIFVRGRHGSVYIIMYGYKVDECLRDFPRIVREDSGMVI